MAAFYNVGIRSRILKLKPQAIVKSLNARNSDTIVVDWVHRGLVKANWGDAIAPLLAEYLSSRHVVNRREILAPNSLVSYTTIGSMLGTVKGNNVEVWGSGFVASDAAPKTVFSGIHAVRGPLTRRKLLEHRQSCPEVYGDPALLTPFLFPFLDWAPQFAVGIIPHYKEQDLPEVTRLSRLDGVNIIDIRAGIEKVVREILKCSFIASSSLHGLVAADSYGIPSAWVRFSHRPAGDGFKFRDYRLSVGRDHRSTDPTGMDLDTLIAVCDDSPLQIDLNAFVNSCPFIAPQVHQSLIEKMVGFGE